MKLITKIPPTKLINRYAKKKELELYFGAISIEELIMNLREFRRRGYLNFDTKINKDYVEWQRQHSDLTLRADVLNHPDPFGLSKKDGYGLSGFHGKISQGESLTEKELIEVLNKLPRDLAERYLEVKIFDIEREKLKMLVPKTKSKKQQYGEASYKGLRISGAEVTFLGQQIPMPFRERETLRVFLERPDTILSSDEFIRNIEIFNPKRVYNNPHKTFSQLVSEVRVKLIPVVRQRCIYSVPSEGWKLHIE